MSHVILIIKLHNYIVADVLSLNGFDAVSISSITSPRYANHRDCDVNVQCPSSIDQLRRPEDLSNFNSAHNSVSGIPKSSGHPTDGDLHVKSDGSSSEVQPVFLDEMSSFADESAGREDGLLDNCGILPNNCLPCLASTVPSVEKRRSLSSSPPSARKKAALKLSFKWREGNSSADLREYLNLTCISNHFQLKLHGTYTCRK